MRGSAFHFLRILFGRQVNRGTWQPGFLGAGEVFAFASKRATTEIGVVQAMGDDDTRADSMVGLHATGTLVGDAQYVSAGSGADTINSDTVLELYGTGDYERVGD